MLLTLNQSGYTTVGEGDISNEEALRKKLIRENRCDQKRSYDEWNGMHCPPGDSVTKIDLTYSRFNGTLPENLYMLTNLHRLNLMGNRIRVSVLSLFSTLLLFQEYPKYGRRVYYLSVHIFTETCELKLA